MPRTVTALQQTIAALKKQKKTALASEYGFYLTAAGKAQLKAFVFQAFLDISPSCVDNNHMRELSSCGLINVVNSFGNFVCVHRPDGFVIRRKSG